MTSTTTETPAERRYTGLELQVIQVHEWERDPFTETELDIIDAYFEQIAGVDDSLDPVAAAAMPEDFGMAQACAHFQAMARLLRDWRQAIDDHWGGLSSSAAGAHFISCQLACWMNSREAQLAALALAILGREPTGERFISELDCLPAGGEAALAFVEVRVL